MPYRLVQFTPGLVQLAVTGHIESDDVDAMRDEGALMLRHIAEPFDAIIDATDFTGLNPLALTQLRALPIPPQLRAVAVVLGGWQLLASKALPRIDGLALVGSLEEAHAALADSPPLAVARAEGMGAPEAAVADAPREPLPQVRRIPARPIPPAHRAPAASRAVGGGLAGGVLRGLARQMNYVSEQLQRLQER